ncbi:ABC transporter permease [Jiangella rhizosphaerae]|uniref:Transport permease protein n=1 Tax=Jiangella rhizosphaerae TaxID=2293569 RepID=A0A418KIA1_9ACTN|nr:ABC transporter permease [Jiangella rhizosphaerae]RIQ12917.1 ABC transporter permease [Jiangella rhizosphaerae]
MSPRITLATAARVLTQLRHDPRTIALMLVVPSLLMTLLWWIYDGGVVFDRIGPALLAIFPFLVMFLVTSIATLRERTSGTLERLLSMPTGKLDFLLGYALAFGAVALLQALITATVALGLLDLDTAGPSWLLIAVAVFDALLGVALGLFVSAFASTEFQVVQFMPALIVPQFLLCGLLVPRDQLPAVLETISDVLPLSYAVDAMSEVQANTDPQVWGQIGVVVAFSVALLALGAATLRRRTP